jgi:hypothetical protein
MCCELSKAFGCPLLRLSRLAQSCTHTGFSSIETAIAKATFATFESKVLPHILSCIISSSRLIAPAYGKVASAQGDRGDA